MPMIENPALDTYRLSFPSETQAPIGIGVTAESLAEACALAARSSVGGWLAKASEVRVRRGVRIADLDAGHVVPNSGPMQLRGVWFPPGNIGFVRGDAVEYVRLDDSGD